MRPSASASPAPVATDDGLPFEDPPWDAPLDPASVIEAIPAEATIAGMFFSYLVTALLSRGIRLSTARERYTQFTFYPVVELARLHVEAAEKLYPDTPLRLGLRRLGKPSAKAFLTSMLGKMTLGTAEGILPAIDAMQKAYEINVKPSAVKVLDRGEDWATLRIERVYHFLDCHHVGALEGLLEYAKTEGRVRIAARGPDAADFLLTWPLPS